MVDKTVTLDELKKLSKDGAEIEITRNPTVIAQFSEMIDKLDAMLKANDERVRADLARNQTNLEILATLQALIRKQDNIPETVDLSPLLSIVEEMRAEREMRDPVPYEFAVKYDSRGALTKIHAEPVSPTKH